MFGTLFALICSDPLRTTGQYNEACRKSFEAGTYSYHLEDKASRVGTAVKDEIAKKTGREPLEVVATAYVIAVKQEITLKTRKVPLVQQTTMGVRRDTGVVTFGWSF